MNTLSRNRRLFARTPRTNHKASARLRPALEALEVRLTPSTLGTTALLEGRFSGSDSVLVNTSGSWSASPSPDARWLHTSSVGQGSGLATFTFDANGGSATRVGTLSIAGQTLTVTQVGGLYTAATAPTILVDRGPVPTSAESVAVDGTGNVYYSDEHGIQKWDAATQQVSTILSVAVRSLDVDELGNNIYFAAGNTINKWSAATQQVTTLVSSGLAGPESIAVDASGNVYIGDSFHSAVKKWNAATGQVTTVVSSASGLNFVFSVAVDAHGNVYIGDNDKAVKKWNPATGQLTTLFSFGTDEPMGVAVDGSGNVFVADFDDGAVKEWNAVTGQLTTLISRGPATTTDVSVDGSGNVYQAGKDIRELPHAFVSTTLGSETAGAGSSALAAPVLPLSQPLTGVFAPTSNQSWLRIENAVNGVVHFSLDENNTMDHRLAQITVLGVPIFVDQAPPLIVSTLADSGAGSLRDAVNSALVNFFGKPALSDVIVIPQSLFTAPAPGQPDPNTIRLASELPVISSYLSLKVRAEVSDSGWEFTVSAQGLGRVIQVQVGGSLTLENLTLTDGKAGPAADGGAVLNYGTLTLTNSAITDSSARAGGGIANAGTLHLVRSLVSGNQATLAGGGVLSLGGTVTIDQSTISDNTVTGQDTTTPKLPTGGGGLFAAAGGTVSVTDSTVSGNTANFVSGIRTADFNWSGGGGIAVQDATTLALTDSTVSDNTVDLWGGGVLVHNAFATVTRSFLARNIADSGAGLANIGYAGNEPVNYHGTVAVQASTVADNKSVHSLSVLSTRPLGSGISNLFFPTTMTIADSTISGNSTTKDVETAVMNDGKATLTLTNTTVSGNKVDGVGNNSFGVMTVTSSTVIDNAGNSPDLVNFNGTLTLGNSIVGTFSNEGRSVHPAWRQPGEERVSRSRGHQCRPDPWPAHRQRGADPDPIVGVL